MKVNGWVVGCMAVALAIPQLARAKDKKKHGAERVMVENMMAVPCGAKQRGLSGLGSLWASAGITHINSDEKLCPQYLLRSDEMEYEVRPTDLKHAVLLPVGEEAEFKIKNNRILMKVPEGDKGQRKVRTYQVVSVSPMNSDSGAQGASFKSPQKPSDLQPPPKPTERVAATPDNRPPM